MFLSVNYLLLHVSALAFDHLQGSHKILPITHTHISFTCRRTFEIPEDGRDLAPKHVAAIIYKKDNGATRYILFCLLLLSEQPPVGHGLLIHEVSRSHTTTHHSRQDSSGRVISPSQGPLPDITQHSQQTDIHAHCGIRTHDLSRRAATVTGRCIFTSKILSTLCSMFRRSLRSLQVELVIRSNEFLRCALTDLIVVLFMDLQLLFTVI